MNIKKTSVLFLLLAVLILSLASCGLFHDHVWQYRIAKEATCTKKGLLELFCTDCGEKDYVDLETLEHEYQDGACVACGAAEVSKQITRSTLSPEADVEGKWSMEAIYDLACTLQFNGTYTRFLSSLSGALLKQAYLDAVGLFHVTVTVPTPRGGTLETPLALPIKKVSVDNPHPSIGRLLRADVVGDELLFTYSDGTQCSAGRFSGDTCITGFGISEAGELVIFYQNNMVGFSGTLQ